jgi:hypothetical protein
MNGWQPQKDPKPLLFNHTTVSKKEGSPTSCQKQGMAEKIWLDLVCVFWFLT